MMMTVRSENAQEALAAGMVPPRSVMHLLKRPVIGIDPQTTRVSVGILAPGYEPMAMTCSLPNTGPPGRRAWLALSMLRRWFDGLDFEIGPPRAIGLEVPNPKAMRGNKQRQIELQGVLYAALWSVWPDVPVSEVFPVSWKAAALGKGHGHAKPVEYVRWAEAACGWVAGPLAPDDEAAALGVATWQALRVVADAGG
jgi:hypothetical protein